MSEQVCLRADDGHELDAYVARPEGEPIAGLVVVQEIFGVNSHIRSVADSYARDGFLAVAPALFDRYERGVELGYEDADMQKARSFFPKLDIDAAVRDTAAALDYARGQTNKKCGVIGYCFGGTIAWLAATRLRADAAVGYYGGQIATFANEQPRCPVMLHFGRKDQHIPKEEVDTIAKAHPEVEIYWYDAGHGFNCDARSSYDAGSAKLARERSLEFLARHLT
ncbi:MAG TPA: dienelactone hydrolase family protein [Silvibacterium sp.]|nr:dienelactone hydrolase family protein [Silvibacterium sp.]